MDMFQMNKEELLNFRNETEAKYNDFKALGLKLDMSRGKPSVRASSALQPLRLKGGFAIM
mgnify:CR=1 FL=1